MGGRIPLSEHKSKMPNDLEQTVISLLTAKEIGWVHNLWISSDLSIPIK